MNLICFSHLRWAFVYQRPQHLMSRFARIYDVFYIEEYTLHDEQDGYNIEFSKENIGVVTPLLQRDAAGDVTTRLQNILNEIFLVHNITPDIFWYYTPMMLDMTANYEPKITIYDCMDELSAFKFAPPELKSLENKLMKKADIVFTGGHHLYSSKKHLHHNIFPFPSSIDKRHFGTARSIQHEMADQEHIPHPRFGFFGVLDERFDIELIRQVAERRPEWQFIMIGPVVKIHPDTLPRNANIHYLGSKSYDELPAYISGWDIALIPFAMNESTRYISPTKTPEYLAAGKPVISSAIADVVSPYGNAGLVHIANDAASFIKKASEELLSTNRSAWLAEVDEFLRPASWDTTWSDMQLLIEKAMRTYDKMATKNKEQYV